MKKIKFIILITLVIIIISGFSISVEVTTGGEIGSFTYQSEGPIQRLQDDFIPINRVADALNYRLNWELWQNKVEGNLHNIFFSTSEFIIYRGQLYLPLEFFEPTFGFNIEKRGNRYFIYSYLELDGELQIDLQTHTNSISSDKPLAVTVILLNNGEEIDLNFSSSQRYDLVLTRFNREVWRLSDGKGYSAVRGTEKLKRGEYLLFTDLIELDFNRGRYNLIAEITASEKTIESKPLTITIN